jgi:septation ring formation regulator EzrA
MEATQMATKLTATSLATSAHPELRSRLLRDIARKRKVSETIVVATSELATLESRIHWLTTQLAEAKSLHSATSGKLQFLHAELIELGDVEDALLANATPRKLANAVVEARESLVASRHAILDLKKKDANRPEVVSKLEAIEEEARKRLDDAWQQVLAWKPNIEHKELVQ